MIPRIHFTLDGSPVDLADWSFSSSADLGFDQFRANATNHRAKKIVGGVQQGSVIEAFTENGQRVWEGTVPQPPKLAQNGVASVAAQGYAYRAAKSGNRMTPIIDNPGAWVPATLDPVNWPVGGFFDEPSITNTLSLRRITFSPSGTAAECGWAFVARGMNITKLSATVSTAGGGQGYWRVLTCKLPDPYRTRRLEFATNGGSAISVKGMAGGQRRGPVAATFEPSDVVVLQLYIHTGNLSSAQESITNPVVQGDYDADVIYSEHAAKIVARQLGWDESGIVGKGQVPLTSSDWVGDGASYMSYIAGLEDYCWGVWDDRGYGPLMTFGPYGRKVWEVNSATGATWDLDPLERVRRVTVQILNVDSSITEVFVDAPDSANLPEGIASELKESLNDNQTEVTLATVTAWRQMQRFLRDRFRGRVAFINAFEEGSRRNAPFEVRGGDLIKITDFSQDGSITLRVHDVEYTPDGVVVGIEAAALPLGGSVRGTVGGAGRGGGLLVTTVTGGAAVYVAPGTSAGPIGAGGNDPYEPPIKHGGGINLGQHK